jgi:gluconate 2-dehydrogenase gamma chain
MSRLIARSGISRRMAMKAFLAMGIGSPALASQPMLSAKAGVGPSGTATDPDLVQPQLLWQRTLDQEALDTLAALTDLILPADERSPAASVLGAPEFIDEWVSAPYPQQQQDRSTLLAGLVWLAKISKARFGRPFVELSSVEQTQICDEICYLPEAADDAVVGAEFFALVRNLSAAAVWTTAEGMADLQYIGNVPLARWEAPPAAVLKHLGLQDP